MVGILVSFPIYYFEETNIQSYSVRVPPEVFEVGRDGTTFMNSSHKQGHVYCFVNINAYVPNPS